MAASLAFGLLFTTLLVLILVPSFYSIYARLAGIGREAEEEPAAGPPSIPAKLVEAEEDEVEVLSS
jgi:hypothetical protein